MPITLFRRHLIKGLLATAALPLLAYTASRSAVASTLKNSILNPWRWQDAHGFVQGRVISANARLILCAGQTSVDADGNPLHKDDMAAQILQALDNLETLLAEGGAQLGQVVRVTYYVKDMAQFFEAMPVLTQRLGEKGCHPTSTLIGVAALFHPDILFEIEATAAL